MKLTKYIKLKEAICKLIKSLTIMIKGPLLEWQTIAITNDDNLS
jgi:hypothetical protein